MAPGVAADAASRAVKNDPAKVKDAATQFEALLIGQMLTQVREASSLEEGDQASMSVREMSEQQLAQVMAANGGLGLANLVVQGLSRVPAQKDQAAGLYSGAAS
jgi:peptidoglycan hydrolase FlgJ